MRKITSKQSEENRKKRNGLILGGILIFIMLFSVLGYSFLGGGKQESSQKIIYNGFEFEEQNGFWNTYLDKFIFTFKYNPKQIDVINAKLNHLEEYLGKPLYISLENNEAQMEIYRNLFYQNKIVQRMQSACLMGEKCDEEMPIKNCEENFIIIKEGEVGQLKQEENCVFIEGRREDLIKIVDEFLFNLIGVR